MTTEHTNPATADLNRKDFKTDQDVRWCPGCGDYAILATLQKVFPDLGIPKEKFAIVSGIGCSSRFPFYMNTYGFHTIHGRAPAVATGLRASNPDLSVWVVTGDGDALSIGGNHLMHAIRRNVNLKILLFNNRIYGLTKGQYSPTSEQGKHTKSTPYGSIDSPVDPVSFVLGSNASFVARTIDREPRHMAAVFERAAHHEGTAFIEIFQNCNIFNDGAFGHLTDRKTKKDQQIPLEDGEKIIFGADDDKCIVRSDWGLKIENVADVDEGEIVIHDEAAPIEYHLMLSRLQREYGTPIGVLRAVDRPSYDTMLHGQIAGAVDQKGPGDLQQLITGSNTWSVGN